MRRFGRGYLKVLDPENIDFANEYQPKYSLEYDVMLEPKDRSKHDAILLEFKAHEAKEPDLEATVERALEQIAEKGYAKEFLGRGFSEEQIQKYGFAFDGKTVLIG